jgi:hypothetical protein
MRAAIIRATASKVGLLEHCQYWATPEAVWNDTSGAAADRGNRFHRAIALYISGVDGLPLSVEDDIAEEFKHAKAFVDSIRAAYPDAELHSEVAFAWDPATDEAESIPAVERDYQAGHGRLCGTADLVVVFPVGGKNILVYDWKTGSGEGAGPQLRALGLMAARAYNAETATTAALEVTAAGVREAAHEHHDAFALAGIAGGLADLIAFIPGAEPRPGDHCGSLYCPARTTCPEVNKAHVALVPEQALVRKFSTDIESPEHAVWMMDRIRLVEVACKAIKDAIKSKVPEGGWELADGSKLIESTRDMPRFDKNKAFALLKQLGATDEQIASLTYTWKESAGLKIVGGPAATKPKRSRSTKAA